MVSLGVKKVWATPRSVLLWVLNSKFPTSIPTPVICGVSPGIECLALINSHYCKSLSSAKRCSPILSPLCNTNDFTDSRIDLVRASNRPIRLTQCRTQFKSPGDKILCVLYLHYNVAFTVGSCKAKCKLKSISISHFRANRRNIVRANNSPHCWDFLFPCARSWRVWPVSNFAQHVTANN